MHYTLAMSVKKLVTISVFIVFIFKCEDQTTENKHENKRDGVREK